MQRQQAPYEKTILICVNERAPEEHSCGPKGAAEIARRFKELVKRAGLNDRVRVSRTLCLGLCESGPNVVVFPENVWYQGVKIGEVEEILRRHLPESKGGSTAPPP